MGWGPPPPTERDEAPVHSGLGLELGQEVGHAVLLVQEPVEPLPHGCGHGWAVRAARDAPPPAGRGTQLTGAGRGGAGAGGTAARARGSRERAPRARPRPAGAVPAPPPPCALRSCHARAGPTPWRRGALPLFPPANGRRFLVPARLFTTHTVPKDRRGEGDLDVCNGARLVWGILSGAKPTKAFLT